MCVLAAWKPLVKRMKETLTGKIINVIKNAMIVDKTKGQFWRKSRTHSQNELQWK